ncbi:heavy metal translocating P-type ATPase [Blautia hansenii]|nr:heavy metal translocating P-type ATPase [Blautia hansenii]ASM69021.1 copper-translocating P-type ATPase [Blautia hansenii DSM 20583]UWO11608.1 heavy metal translocating P-type ATPase [Blautia hansenii DSM 20583]
MNKKYKVTGMTCSACSSRVEKCVGKLDGVNTVSVNLLTNSMQIDFDESKLTEEKIADSVTQAGYGMEIPTVKSEKKEEKEDIVEKNIENMKKRTIWSFIFLIPLMYVAMGHMAGLPQPSFLRGDANAVSFALTQLLLCIPVLYINRAYFERGFRSLIHGAPNMDTLISVGSGASLIYGIFAIYRMGYGLGTQNMELVHRYLHDLYFESAVMILALINIGKYLEARSKGKTSEAIQKLMDLAPKTALVERNGQVVEIAAEDMLTGDILQVKPGSSIPADGVVIEGRTSVDEAAITGESMPVEKKEGDTVTAATLNKTGFIRMRAARVGQDTTFSQIIRLVEEASSSKAPIARMADKIAGIFVPTVMGIALLTGIVWLLMGAEFEFALSCAIAVLVISCPCALGLATPVAIMVGTGKGAENGILIKSGEALEITHNVQSVVLDKTGTITEGKPVVTDIISFGMSENKILEISAALEKKSEHPLAEAVLLKAKGMELPNAENFAAIPGKGITAKIQGNIYYAGNQKLMQEQGISCEKALSSMEKLSKEGKTPLILADEKQVFGIIGVADVVKPTSAKAIQELKKLGIQVIMLTGDNARTAKAIQKQLDIDTVIAEVLPQDKEREISRLQEEGKTVAMVGDGLNDAPALARSDVGIAIGAGTDVAIESADIVLMKNDLQDVATAIELSKAVIRNIKENLFWAFFYNVCGIPLAAGVLYPVFGLKLSPMFGAAAMSLSSLFVVSNALRLRFFHSLKKGKTQPESIQEKKEEKNMYTMKIEGMMCPHCQAAVTKALEALEGTKAEVNLEKKEAYVETGLEKEALKKAVEDAGYQVLSVE